MNYIFFHILAIDPERETKRLNEFLQKHSIHSLDRQFVAEGTNSFWSICVVTHDNNKSDHSMYKQTSSGKKPRIDYQAELDPEHFTIFARLREFRNQIANDFDVAPYAVFTNDQLSKISQLQGINLETMSQIKGIGGKRLKVYAVRLLEKMAGKGESLGD
ncbi:MAG TPA: hypothetical protein EYH19_08870 [Desulfocapsa sulfexigens]|nr:hypothetical protein [Desulfocapsa sulfexigens]